MPKIALIKGLSHEGCFHRRSVELSNSSLYHYFKNYDRPHFLAVVDVGTGHRGTSVMTICMYPRPCHVVIPHDHGRPIPTSPTPLGHTKYITPGYLDCLSLSLSLAGSLGQYKLMSNSLGQLNIYTSWIIGSV